jgi:glycyl-tRNA synthetase beta subunit
VSSSVTKKALTKIINKSISKHDFPNLMQIGKTTPIYKGGKDASRLNKKFFRPVSVLIAFSKVFKRYILEKMLEHVNLILSDKISAYRKGYSTQHVLLKLTEEWRKHLDSNKVVGAVLMDLS